MNAGRPSARTTPQDLAREIDELLEECRDTCLWYQPRGYRPHTDAERWLALDAIQKHANTRTFRRAARLKEWLSRLSSTASAGP